MQWPLSRLPEINKQLSVILNFACCSNNTVKSVFLTSPIFTSNSINLLMPGGNKKDHTYLNKPASDSFRFVEVCVTLLLPPGFCYHLVILDLKLFRPLIFNTFMSLTHTDSTFVYHGRKSILSA